MAGAMGGRRVDGAGCMAGRGPLYKSSQRMGERGRVRRECRSRTGLLIRNCRPNFPRPLTSSPFPAPTLFFLLPLLFPALA